jgi:hypothetical protein
MVIKELCEQKLIKLNNILDLLAFAPPFVISQILRTNPIIIMSHRINSDSNHENEEHKEAVLDTNNSRDEKIHKANKLREKK